MAESNIFEIAVAVANDKSCFQAVQFAVDLASRLKDNYKLHFIYVVSTSPKTKLPIIDRLEKSYNIEVHDEGIRDMRELLAWLDVAASGVEYEFVKFEKEETTEEVLKHYVEQHKISMFVVGSHRSGALSKFMLGSTSQFCVDHLNCPVVVVKPDTE